jgi:drug/metabolite transporter (DMT)-like permease
MKVGIAFALIVAITGQVLYHITQKSVATGAHPVVSLIGFYVIAALLSLPLFLLFPVTGSVVEEVGKLNWAVYAVGASIVLIEIGFLLAYRAGAELSGAFVLTSAAVTISTLLVGLFFFREAVSLTRLAGIVLCLAGIGLISWKSAP